MDNKKNETISVYLPTYMIEWIDGKRKDRFMSRSTLVKLLIQEAISNDTTQSEVNE